MQTKNNTTQSLFREMGSKKISSPQIERISSLDGGRPPVMIFTSRGKVSPKSPSSRIFETLNESSLKEIIGSERLSETRNNESVGTGRHVNGKVTANGVSSGKEGISKLRRPAPVPPMTTQTVPGAGNSLISTRALSLSSSLHSLNNRHPLESDNKVRPPLIPAPKAFIQRQSSLSSSTSSLSSHTSLQTSSMSQPQPVITKQQVTSELFSLPSPPPDANNNNDVMVQTSATTEEKQHLAYTKKTQAPEPPAHALRAPSPPPPPPYMPPYSPLPPVQSESSSLSSSSASSSPLDRFRFPPPPSTPPSPIEGPDTSTSFTNTSVSTTVMLSSHSDKDEGGKRSMSPSEVMDYFDEAIGHPALSASSYNDTSCLPEFSPVFHFPSVSDDKLPETLSPMIETSTAASREETEQVLESTSEGEEAVEITGKADSVLDSILEPEVLASRRDDVLESRKEEEEELLESRSVVVLESRREAGKVVESNRDAEDMVESRGDEVLESIRGDVLESRRDEVLESIKDDVIESRRDDVLESRKEAEDVLESIGDAVLESRRETKEVVAYKIEGDRMIQPMAITQHASASSYTVDKQNNDSDDNLRAKSPHSLRETSEDNYAHSPGIHSSLSPKSEEERQKRNNANSKTVAVTKLRPEVKTVRQYIKPGTVDELAHLFSSLKDDTIMSPANKSEFDFNIRETLEKLGSLDKSTENKSPVNRNTKRSTILSPNELFPRLQSSASAENLQSPSKSQHTLAYTKVNQWPRLYQASSAHNVSSPPAALLDPQTSPGFDFLSASREIHKHVVLIRSSSRTGTSTSNKVNDISRESSHLLGNVSGSVSIPSDSSSSEIVLPPNDQLTQSMADAYSRQKEDLFTSTTSSVSESAKRDSGHLDVVIAASELLKNEDISTFAVTSGSHDMSALPPPTITPANSKSSSRRSSLEDVINTTDHIDNYSINVAVDEAPTVSEVNQHARSRSSSKASSTNTQSGSQNSSRRNSLEETRKKEDSIKFSASVELEEAALSVASRPARARSRSRSSSPDRKSFVDKAHSLSYVVDDGTLPVSTTTISRSSSRSSSMKSAKSTEHKTRTSDSSESSASTPAANSRSSSRASSVIRKEDIIDRNVDNKSFNVDNDLAYRISSSFNSANEIDMNLTDTWARKVGLGDHSDTNVPSVSSYSMNTSSYVIQSGHHEIIDSGIGIADNDQNITTTAPTSRSSSRSGSFKIKDAKKEVTLEQADDVAEKAAKSTGSHKSSSNSSRASSPDNISSNHVMAIRNASPHDLFRRVSISESSRRSSQAESEKMEANRKVSNSYENVIIHAGTSAISSRESGGQWESPKVGLDDDVNHELVSSAVGSVAVETSSPSAASNRSSSSSRSSSPERNSGSQDIVQLSDSAFLNTSVAISSPPRSRRSSQDGEERMDSNNNALGIYENVTVLTTDADSSSSLNSSRSGSLKVLDKADDVNLEHFSSAVNMQHSRPTVEAVDVIANFATSPAYSSSSSRSTSPNRKIRSEDIIHSVDNTFASNRASFSSTADSDRQSSGEGMGSETRANEAHVHTELTTLANEITNPAGFLTAETKSEETTIFTVWDDNTTKHTTRSNISPNSSKSSSREGSRDRNQSGGLVSMDAKTTSSTPSSSRGSSRAGSVISLKKQNHSESFSEALQKSLATTVKSGSSSPSCDRSRSNSVNEDRRQEFGRHVQHEDYQVTVVSSASLHSQSRPDNNNDNLEHELLKSKPSLKSVSSSSSSSRSSSPTKGNRLEKLHSQSHNTDYTNVPIPVSTALTGSSKSSRESSPEGNNEAAVEQSSLYSEIFSGNTVSTFSAAESNASSRRNSHTRSMTGHIHVEKEEQDKNVSSLSNSPTSSRRSSSSSSAADTVKSKGELHDGAINLYARELQDTSAPAVTDTNIATVSRSTSRASSVQHNQSREEISHSPTHMDSANMAAIVSFPHYDGSWDHREETALLISKSSSSTSTAPPGSRRASHDGGLAIDTDLYNRNVFSDLVTPVIQHAEFLRVDSYVVTGSGQSSPGGTLTRTTTLDNQDTDSYQLALQTALDSTLVTSVTTNNRRDSQSFDRRDSQTSHNSSDSSKQSSRSESPSRSTSSNLKSDYYNVPQMNTSSTHTFEDVSVTNIIVPTFNQPEKGFDNSDDVSLPNSQELDTSRPVIKDIIDTPKNEHAAIYAFSGAQEISREVLDSSPERKHFNMHYNELENKHLEATEFKDTHSFEVFHPTSDGEIRASDFVANVNISETENISRLDSMFHLATAASDANKVADTEVSQSMNDVLRASSGSFSYSTDMYSQQHAINDSHQNIDVTSEENKDDSSDDGHVKVKAGVRPSVEYGQTVVDIHASDKDETLSQMSIRSQFGSDTDVVVKSPDKDSDSSDTESSLSREGFQASYTLQEVIGEDSAASIDRGTMYPQQDLTDEIAIISTKRLSSSYNGTEGQFPEVNQTVLEAESVVAVVPSEQESNMASRRSSSSSSACDASFKNEQSRQTSGTHVTDSSSQPKDFLSVLDDINIDTDITSGFLRRSSRFSGTSSPDRRQSKDVKHDSKDDGTHARVAVGRHSDTEANLTNTSLILSNLQAEGLCDKTEVGHEEHTNRLDVNNQFFDPDVILPETLGVLENKPVAHTSLNYQEPLSVTYDEKLHQTSHNLVTMSNSDREFLVGYDANVGQINKDISVDKIVHSTVPNTEINSERQPYFSTDTGADISGTSYWELTPRTADVVKTGTEEAQDLTGISTNKTIESTYVNEDLPFSSRETGVKDEMEEQMFAVSVENKLAHEYKNDNAHHAVGHLSVEATDIEGIHDNLREDKEQIHSYVSDIIQHSVHTVSTEETDTSDWTVAADYPIPELVSEVNVDALEADSNGHGYLMDYRTATDEAKHSFGVSVDEPYINEEYLTTDFQAGTSANEKFKTSGLEYKLEDNSIYESVVKMEVANTSSHAHSEFNEDHDFSEPDVNDVGGIRTDAFKKDDVSLDLQETTASLDTYVSDIIHHSFDKLNTEKQESQDPDLSVDHISSSHVSVNHNEHHEIDKMKTEPYTATSEQEVRLDSHSSTDDVSRSIQYGYSNVQQNFMEHSSQDIAVNLVQEEAKLMDNVVLPSNVNHSVIETNADERNQDETSIAYEEIKSQKHYLNNTGIDGVPILHGSSGVREIGSENIHPHVAAELESSYVNEGLYEAMGKEQTITTDTESSISEKILTKSGYSVPGDIVQLHDYDITRREVEINSQREFNNVDFIESPVDVVYRSHVETHPPVAVEYENAITSKHVPDPSYRQESKDYHNMEVASENTENVLGRLNVDVSGNHNLPTDIQTSSESEKSYSGDVTKADVHRFRDENFEERERKTQHFVDEIMERKSINKDLFSAAAIFYRLDSMGASEEDNKGSDALFQVNAKMESSWETHEVVQNEAEIDFDEQIRKQHQVLSPALSADAEFDKLLNFSPETSRSSRGSVSSLHTDGGADSLHRTKETTFNREFFVASDEPGGGGNFILPKQNSDETYENETTGELERTTHWRTEKDLSKAADGHRSTSASSRSSVRSEDSDSHHRPKETTFDREFFVPSDEPGDGGNFILSKQNSYETYENETTGELERTTHWRTEKDLSKAADEHRSTSASSRSSVRSVDSNSHHRPKETTFDREFFVPSDEPGDGGNLILSKQNSAETYENETTGDLERTTHWRTEKDLIKAADEHRSTSTSSRSSVRSVDSDSHHRPKETTFNREFFMASDEPPGDGGNLILSKQNSDETYENETTGELERTTHWGTEKDLSKAADEYKSTSTSSRSSVRSVDSDGGDQHHHHHTVMTSDHFSKVANTADTGVHDASTTGLLLIADDAVSSASKHEYERSSSEVEGVDTAVVRTVIHKDFMEDKGEKVSFGDLAPQEPAESGEKGNDVDFKSVKQTKEEYITLTRLSSKDEESLVQKEDESHLFSRDKFRALRSVFEKQQENIPLTSSATHKRNSYKFSTASSSVGDSQPVSNWELKRQISSGSTKSQQYPDDSSQASSDKKDMQTNVSSAIEGYTSVESDSDRMIVPPGDSDNVSSQETSNRVQKKVVLNKKLSYDLQTRELRRGSLSSTDSIKSTSSKASTKQIELDTDFLNKEVEHYSSAVEHETHYPKNTLFSQKPGVMNLTQWNTQQTYNDDGGQTQRRSSTSSSNSSIFEDTAIPTATGHGDYSHQEIPQDSHPPRETTHDELAVVDNAVSNPYFSDSSAGSNEERLVRKRTNSLSSLSSNRSTQPSSLDIEDDTIFSQDDDGRLSATGYHKTTELSAAFTRETISANASTSSVRRESPMRPDVDGSYLPADDNFSFLRNSQRTATTIEPLVIDVKSPDTKTITSHSSTSGHLVRRNSSSGSEKEARLIGAFLRTSGKSAVLDLSSRASNDHSKMGTGEDVSTESISKTKITDVVQSRRRESSSSESNSSYDADFSRHTGAIDSDITLIQAPKQHVRNGDDLTTITSNVENHIFQSEGAFTAKSHDNQMTSRRDSLTSQDDTHKSDLHLVQGEQSDFYSRQDIEESDINADNKQKVKIYVVKRSMAVDLPEDPNENPHDSVILNSHPHVTQNSSRSLYTDISSVNHRKAREVTELYSDTQDSIRQKQYRSSPFGADLSSHESKEDHLSLENDRGNRDTVGPYFTYQGTQKRTGLDTAPIFPSLLSRDTTAQEPVRYTVAHRDRDTYSGGDYVRSRSYDRYTTRQNLQDEGFRRSQLRSPRVVDTANDIENHSSRFSPGSATIYRSRHGSVEDRFGFTPISVTTASHAVVGDKVGVHIDFKPLEGVHSSGNADYSSDEDDKEKRFIVKNITEESLLKRSLDNTSPNTILPKEETVTQDADQNIRLNGSLSPRTVVDGPIYRTHQGQRSHVSRSLSSDNSLTSPRSDNTDFRSKTYDLVSTNENNEDNKNDKLYKLVNRSADRELETEEVERGRSRYRSTNSISTENTSKTARKHHSPERFFKNPKLSLRQEDYNTKEYSPDDNDGKHYRHVTRVYLSGDTQRSRSPSPSTHYKVSTLQSHTSVGINENRTVVDSSPAYHVSNVTSSHNVRNSSPETSDSDSTSGFQKHKQRYRVIGTSDSSLDNQKVRAQSSPRFDRKHETHYKETTITRTESGQPLGSAPSEKWHRTTVQPGVNTGSNIIQQSGGPGDSRSSRYLVKRVKSAEDLRDSSLAIHEDLTTSGGAKMWKTGRSSSTERYLHHTDGVDGGSGSRYFVGRTLNNPRENHENNSVPPGRYRSTVDVNGPGERLNSQSYRTEKTVYVSNKTSPEFNTGKRFQNAREFVFQNYGPGTELPSSNGQIHRERAEIVDAAGEDKEESHLLDYTRSTEDLSNDLRVLRGKILIKNRFDSAEFSEDDFDQNANLFDTSFHLGKDNPVYSSDPDIAASLRKEEERDLSKHVNQDITFETVDRLAHQYKANRQIQLSPGPQRKKPNLSSLLLSKLALVDSKDIRQTVDVENHHEEIHGDIRFVHADGEQKESKDTYNFDSVNEKVELTLTHGKAFVIIKVIAERVVPTNTEFSIWRKSQAIVTRQIEIDLQANDHMKRLYKQVMSKNKSSGSLEGSSRISTYNSASLSPQEREMNSMETLKLFTQILDVAEAQSNRDNPDSRARHDLGQIPASVMDMLY